MFHFFLIQFYRKVSGDEKDCGSGQDWPKSKWTEKRKLVKYYLFLLILFVNTIQVYSEFTFFMQKLYLMSVAKIEPDEANFLALRSLIYKFC